MDTLEQNSPYLKEMEMQNEGKDFFFKLNGKEQFDESLDLVVMITPQEGDYPQLEVSLTKTAVKEN